jgi:hypothetical protein
MTGTGATFMIRQAVTCALLLVLTSGIVLARKKIPLPLRLEYAEYCVLLKVTKVEQRNVEFDTVELLRSPDGKAPKIDLFSGKPEKGKTYLVLSSDNHPTDKTATEYQFHFFEVVTAGDRTTILQIEPDRENEDRTFKDLEMSDFKDLLKKHPFKSQKK